MAPVIEDVHLDHIEVLLSKQEYCAMQKVCAVVSNPFVLYCWQNQEYCLQPLTRNRDKKRKGWCGLPTFEWQTTANLQAFHLSAGFVKKTLSPVDGIWTTTLVALVGRPFFQWYWTIVPIWSIPLPLKVVCQICVFITIIRGTLENRKDKLTAMTSNRMSPQDELNTLLENGMPIPGIGTILLEIPPADLEYNASGTVQAKRNSKTGEALLYVNSLPKCKGITIQKASTPLNADGKRSLEGWFLVASTPKVAQKSLKADW